LINRNDSRKSRLPQQILSVKHLSLIVSVAPKS
jgi:hypothetical protein